LVDIVPTEILSRKQRVSIQRGSKQEPPGSTSTKWLEQVEKGQEMISSSIGIIDSTRLVEALHRARRGQYIPINILRRTLMLESWLRHLTVHKVLAGSISMKMNDGTSSLPGLGNLDSRAAQSSAS
jgi:hypothetical protein